MIPKLYKYRSINETNWNYTLEIILKNSVYFSAPKDFNDPYETQFRVELIDKNNINNFKKVVKKMVPKYHNMTNNEAEKDIQDTINKVGLFRIQEVWWELALKSHQFFSNKIGIYCLSASPDNMLMWGHYSDGHRGVCIEFDDSTENKIFSKSLVKVNYKDTLPLISLKDLLYFDYSISKSIAMLKVFSTKPKEWKYEKEWRLLDVIRGSGVHKVGNNIISRVILGSSIDFKKKNKLIQIIKTKTPHIKIIQAMKDPDKFGLRFFDIDSKNEIYMQNEK